MKYKTLKCSKCKKTKRYNAFAKGPYSSREGRQYVCRECTSKYDVEHYKKKALMVRTNQLFYYYGITPQQYQEIYDAQGGKCAICSVPKNPWRGERGSNHLDSLFVDHDHVTKKVRGLLCHKCNFGIGQFKDDPELILAAYRYISLFQ